MYLWWIPGFVKVLTLNIKTHGCDMNSGSENLAITDRTYFKAINTVSPNVVISSTKGLTTLFQANVRHNITVPKSLKWDEIKLPWHMRIK